ncbi:MAG: hypothetical protein WA814_02755 [Candidatus Baltobacteraceae bacterium]
MISNSAFAFDERSRCTKAKSHTQHLSFARYMVTVIYYYGSARKIKEGALGARPVYSQCGH